MFYADPPGSEKAYYWPHPEIYSSPFSFRHLLVILRVFTTGGTAIGRAGESRLS